MHSYFKQYVFDKPKIDNISRKWWTDKVYSKSIREIREILLFRGILRKQRKKYLVGSPFKGCWHENN